MKRKIEVLILLLIGVFILFKRYELYYFFQGKRYLRPNEKLELVVKPRYKQIEYSSELSIESSEKILLKLEGQDPWVESTTNQNYITFEDSFYYYDIKEQTISRDGVDILSSPTVVEEGYKDTVIDEGGIIVPVKGQRLYSVTEDHDYTITITNLSDKPVAFSAIVTNR